MQIIEAGPNIVDKLPLKRAQRQVCASCPHPRFGAYWRRASS
jgi:hypothetical protein